MAPLQKFAETQLHTTKAIKHMLYCRFLACMLLKFACINTMIELKPKRIFLIDGLGAILSAILLGVVLVRFERSFGIPSSTLYLLAILPILFAAYDFICYRTNGNNIRLLLKGIAIMNLLYCCMTIGFAFHHTSSITILGWTYILVEVSIVITLAVIELRSANK